MADNAGWTDETVVDFDNTPDELVNLPDGLYLFDIAKVEPKKTKKGVQALEVVLKAASVVGGGDLPMGAKGLYETISFGADQLFSAKNLLKTLSIPFPTKINFEILTELAAEILGHKQVMAKTSTSAASGGFAAKARVHRYYSEESLAAAQATGDGAAVTSSDAAPAAPARRRRGAEAAAA
jgi:hypothetical protein